MERNVALRSLAWLGRHEFGTLLAVGGLAAGVWMFAELADEVMEGGTQKLDRTLLLALRRPGDLQPIGSPAVQDAARDVTALGGVTVLGLLTVSTGLFLTLDGKKHMGLFLFGSVAGGMLVSVLLKDAFERPQAGSSALRRVCVALEFSQRPFHDVGRHLFSAGSAVGAIPGA